MSQRRALAGLFSVLTLAFAGVAIWAIAGAGDSVRRWVVAVAAAAISTWFATLAPYSTTGAPKWAFELAIILRAAVLVACLVGYVRHRTPQTEPLLGREEERVEAVG